MDQDINVIFILVFWTGLYLSIQGWKVWHGQKLDSGPSLIPVYPITPLALLGAGAMMNAIFPWVGTILVLAIHVGWVVYVVVDLIKCPIDSKQ